MANFDGFPVDHYQGRMSGTFDIDQADGEQYVKYGHSVVLMVLAKVGPANLSEDKNGDMRRLNTLTVDAVRFVSPEQQSDLMTELGVPHQLGLLTPLKTPELVATPDGYVDEGGAVLGEGSEVLGSPVSEAPAARIGAGDDGWYDTDSRPVDKPYPADPEPPKDGVVGRIPPPKDPRLARFLDEAGAR